MINKSIEKGLAEPSQVDAASRGTLAFMYGFLFLN